MLDIALTPEAVPLLCQLLIAGTATLYLVSLPRRTRATRWLSAMLAFSAVFSLGFLISSLVPAGSPWEIRATLLLYIGVLLSMLSGVQAAYTFLAAPFRRERRIVAWVSAVLAVALIVPAIWAGITLDVPLATGLLAPFGVALVIGSIWAIAVSLRQSGRLRRLSTRTEVRRDDRHRAMQGHHAFVALIFIDLALALINAGVTFGLLPLLALQYGSLLGQIVVSVGFVVLVINYAPEPTTVQAKLVGLTLACVLAVLGVSALVTLRPTELARTAGNVVPERVSLRFEPASGGGYTVEQQRPSALPELSGSPEARAGEVALPFAFPFGESLQRSVHVACLPVVTFAEAVRTSEPQDIVFGDYAAMFAFAGPGRSADGACARSDVTQERAVFEWSRRDLVGRTALHRLTLFPDGAFELAYSGARLNPTLGGVGFRFADGAPYVSAALAEGLPRVIPPGTGLMDAYSPRYRAVAHARTLPLALLVFGATAFVLLFFPMFLRRSVLGPLRDLLGGVERVQLGGEGARVPSRTSDEFGLLARSFNSMAVSVETAQERLRTYAEGLESRVVERTVDLSQALERQTQIQAQLVEAEKAAALGRLVSGIAHEIKNPLNFVTNFAGLSREAVEDLQQAIREGDTEEAEALLADLAVNAEKIQVHGLRADAIVRAMQLHARGAASGERIPTDLNGLLRLAADAASQQHPDLPPVVLDLADDVGQVLVAPEGVMQAVLNLLDNALWASREAEGDGSPPQVLLCSAREGDHVVVRVCDRGPGLTPEARQHLFEPFFTTRPTGEGIGLGLSLAHGIITGGHGGRLDVESEPGEGATFVVSLPVD